jgi:chromosome partitioning protein
MGRSQAAFRWLTECRKLSGFHLVPDSSPGSTHALVKRNLTNGYLKDTQQLPGSFQLLDGHRTAFEFLSRQRRGDNSVPVIPVAISKGGAGKTTTVVVVATELCKRGATVTIIDTDPRQHVVDWAILPNAPKTLNVIGRPSWREKSPSNRSAELPPHLRLDVTEDRLVDLIEEASTQTAFVLVDLEGTANLMASYAISMADFVLIPVQGSQLDAKEAAAVISLVMQQGRLVHRDIPYAIALTKTNPAVVYGTQRHVQKTLEEGRVPVMQTQLCDREPYRAIFSYGGTLADLREKLKTPSQIESLENAQRNAALFTNEIIGRLKAARKSAATNDAIEAAE